jgi:hypothetical protein
MYSFSLTISQYPAKIISPHCWELNPGPEYAGQALKCSTLSYIPSAQLFPIYLYLLEVQAFLAYPFYWISYFYHPLQTRLLLVCHSYLHFPNIEHFLLYRMFFPFSLVYESLLFFWNLHINHCS